MHTRAHTHIQVFTPFPTLCDASRLTHTVNHACCPHILRPPLLKTYQKVSQRVPVPLCPYSASMDQRASKYWTTCYCRRQTCVGLQACVGPYAKYWTVCKCVLDCVLYIGPYDPMHRCIDRMLYAFAVALAHILIANLVLHQKGSC